MIDLISEFCSSKVGVEWRRNKRAMDERKWMHNHLEFNFLCNWLFPLKFVCSSMVYNLLQPKKKAIGNNMIWMEEDTRVRLGSTTNQTTMFTPLWQH